MPKIRRLSHSTSLDVLFIFILIISLLLKIVSLRGGNFPFTMDQARDMLALRGMAVGLEPALVGPTTSINGVFLGPFWYYFNLPAFILSGGHPAALVYWQIFGYMIAAALLYFFISKSHSLFAFIVSALFLFTPAFFYASRYSWNANAMPIFTAIYFISLVETLLKPSRNRLVWLGLIAGLSFQIEAAFAILFFPIAFVCLLFISKARSWTKLGQLSLGFFVTLLPQLLFELRHNFIMTKVFLAELSGKAGILGERIGFSQRVADRFDNYRGLLHGLLRLSGGWIELLFIVASVVVTILIVKDKLKDRSRLYGLLSIVFIIGSFLFYLLYPNRLKGWFITGLLLPYLFIISLFFSWLFEQKKLLLSLILTAFLALLVFKQAKVEFDHIPRAASQPSTDRSQLYNELATLDWVYQNAAGLPFKAYNYIPSVYDLPYQYLYWWYGSKAYGYHPDTVTYQDGVPEYIKDSSQYWNKRRLITGDNYPIFLIMETDFDHPDFLQLWRGRFNDLCLEAESNFAWTSQAQMLYSCP